MIFMIFFTIIVTQLWSYTNNWVNNVQLILNRIHKLIDLITFRDSIMGTALLGEIDQSRW